MALQEEGLKPAGWLPSQESHVIVTATGVIPDYVAPPPNTIHSPQGLQRTKRPETMSKHLIRLSELCERITGRPEVPLLCKYERSVPMYSLNTTWINVRYYLYGKSSAFVDYPTLRGEHISPC